MANVFLNDEAYAILKAAKKEKESFSDVVVREVAVQNRVKEFLGSCKGMDVKKMIREIETIISD